MIAHAFQEGWILIRRRLVLSVVLASSLGIPLAIAGFTASLGLWAGPLMNLETEKIVVRVLLHPRMEQAQREQWVVEQGQKHSEWKLTLVPEKELAGRLKLWFPYLRDLLEGENAMELPPLVEVEAPIPEDVAILSEGPAVIAVGPQSSVNRVLGQSARTLAGLLGLLSGALTAAAFIFAATWIHLEVFRHAEEISIMRLVGVTEGAIRSPFVVAAAVPGLFGGLAALCGTIFLVNRMEAVVLRFGLEPPSVPLWVMISEVGCGFFLPVFAAVLTLVRHARSSEG